MRGTAHAALLLLLLWLSGCDIVFRLDELDRGDAGPRSEDALDAPFVRACGSSHTGVVAVYPSDGDEETMRLSDAGPNAIHGTSSGAITLTPGPADCDHGLLVEDGESVVIPHHAAFELDDGSIDLWARTIALSSTIPTRVVIARDQTGNNRGDVTLYEHRTGTGELMFIARLQSGGASAGGGTYRCSIGLTQVKWYHVALNFGAAGFELVLDGQVQNRTGTFTVNGETWICGTNDTEQDPRVGIRADSNKPFYVGFGDVFETGVVRRYFSGGGIDHVRISSDRF